MSAGTGERAEIHRGQDEVLILIIIRATSVAIMDHQRALENQLSGYLLRKFKNSNGWQKLWVVFTNFCLYFYKTFQV